MKQQINVKTVWTIVLFAKLIYNARNARLVIFGTI